MRALGSLAPLRLRRLESRRIHCSPDGLGRLWTGALGFLGATQADQDRWLAQFRGLLDGLKGPIQVLMIFEPGSDPGGAIQSQARPDSIEAMRQADLDFARMLASSPNAQDRRVGMVAAEDELADITAQLTQLGVPIIADPAPDAEESIVELEESTSYCRDRAGWHRTWYLERFPGLELAPGWLLKLVPAGAKVSLSWHANPLPSSWVVEYLQRQLTSMRADRLVKGAGGSSDPILEGALPAALDLQRRLAASQERAYHVALYLTLTADTPEGLDEGSQHLLAASRAALCRLQSCNFRMADGRLATLPYGRDRLQRWHVLDTSSLATMFPWLDADLRHPAGLVLGRSRATGSPVLIDPFDSDRFENANIGVFGHSGAGKTYLLSSLLMSAMGTGVQAFVIDPEREYGSLARALGGLEVNLSLGSGHALNVLAPAPANGADESWLGPAVADAADLIGIICGGIDESERAVVEDAVRRAYDATAEPVLAGVCAELPGETRTSRILSRWISGSLGRIFSCPTNVDLDAPVVSFALRELREELIGPVHFLIAEALWSRIKARDRRRLLVVDELGLLFEDPTIRRFVVSLARRIRKYRGGLVFATQNPGDLFSSEAGAVVATNPAIHFFGAQRPGEALKLQRAFQLSDSQRSMIETARRGDFLLAAASERLPIRVTAPPWQEDVMNESRSQTIPSV